MDIWSVGCVFFEMISLFPLFPGTNEKDQVHKIHNILGTPAREILDRFQKYASHMDFNFPTTVGTGITQLIPHASSECQELISKMLTYNPDERITARQALNSPYFKDLKAQDSKVSQANIHKELSAGSPTSSDNEHSAYGQDPQATKRDSKPEDPAPDYQVKKKGQQGMKKFVEHNPDQTNSEYDDPSNVNKWFYLIIAPTN